MKPRLERLETRDAPVTVLGTGVLLADLDWSHGIDAVRGIQQQVGQVQQSLDTDSPSPSRLAADQTKATSLGGDLQGTANRLVMDLELITGLTWASFATGDTEDQLIGVLSLANAKQTVGSVAFSSIAVNDPVAG
jgi:hypothetical protein